MFIKATPLIFSLFIFQLFSFNFSSLASSQDRNYDPQDPIEVKAQRIQKQPIDEIFKLRCYDLIEIVHNPSLLTPEQKDTFIRAKLPEFENNPFLPTPAEKDQFISETFREECVRRNYIPAVHENIERNMSEALKVLEKKYSANNLSTDRIYQDLDDMLAKARNTAEAQSLMDDSENRPLLIILDAFNRIFSYQADLNHYFVPSRQRTGIDHCCYCEIVGVKLGLAGLKPYDKLFSTKLILTPKEIDDLLGYWKENLKTAINLYKIEEDKPVAFLNIYRFTPYWFDLLCKIGASAKSQIEVRNFDESPPEAPLMSVNNYLLALDAIDLESFSKESRPWWKDSSWTR